MRRKNCYQSKKDSPNWGDIIKLPETTVTNSNGIALFQDGNEKFSSKYSDSTLECDGKVSSFSCTIK